MMGSIVGLRSLEHLGDALDERISGVLDAVIAVGEALHRVSVHTVAVLERSRLKLRVERVLAPGHDLAVRLGDLLVEQALGEAQGDAKKLKEALGGK